MIDIRKGIGMTSARTRDRLVQRLRDQGIRISFWAAHRLTYIGFFFNNVIPGATGGGAAR